MNVMMKSMLRRTQRHLVSLGQSDRDAGHYDASLVKLFRDWNTLGYYGGKHLAYLADEIEESRVEELTRREMAEIARGG